jgi:hypothetical protein
VKGKGKEKRKRKGKSERKRKNKSKGKGKSKSIVKANTKAKAKEKANEKAKAKANEKAKQSKIIVAQDFGLSSSFGCGINYQPTTIKLKDERKNAGQAKEMNNGLANM